MNRLITMIFLTFFITVAPAFGKDATPQEWSVRERSGEVQMLRSGAQPVSLRSDSKLAAGDVIITGATGRAMLSQNVDYVMVAPNSRVRIPAATPPGGMTRFFQQVGTLLYKVRHTGVPHFQVDTPALAAVVKGTTFTVIVGPDRSAVQVTEGKVEVSATSSGMMRLVTPGETVFVDNEAPDDLIIASAETVGTITGTIGNDTVHISGISPSSLSDIGPQTAGLVKEAIAAVSAPTVTALASSQADITPTPVTESLGTVAPVILGSTISPVTLPVTVPPVTTLVLPDTPIATTLPLPPVSVPPVTLPPITVPPVLPPITLPPVSVPPVTLPPVTVPPVLPPVTVPIPIPGL